MTKNNTLLPSGFADVLPRTAAQEGVVIGKLMTCFSQFGYKRVKPPIMEFEASILESNNGDITQQTFRVMDPESKEMLVIRSDMTTQIARIATTRLQDEARPLRLCYDGQVMRVTGEGLHQERQLSQVGIELVGIDSIEADAESVIIAAESLAQNNLKNISIDFNLPTLSKILGADENLRKAIARRDRNEIAKLSGNNKELYENLLDCNDIESIKSLNLPENAKVLIDTLDSIITLVKKACPEVSLSVDLLDHKGFEYYTGFSFTIYSKKNDEELGHGGHYIIGHEGENACGFSLSINSILRAIPLLEEPETKSVSINTSLDEIRKLQADGFLTVFNAD